MDIKHKGLILSVLIIIGGLIFFIFSNEEEPVPSKSNEEIATEEELPPAENEINEEKENFEEAAVTSEDPVREFFSDKLKKAADFFFAQDVKVVALGDSLTKGSGDETKNGGYIGVLDDTLNAEQQQVEFQNFAISGSRSGQLLNRLEEEEVIYAVA